MSHVLDVSFKLFEDYAEKMSKSTQRQAWTGWLEQTVLCYIQCMLNSSSKIRAKKSEEVVNKIREDSIEIETRFEEYMTKRQMKNGIEVLDDLISFFESSPDFISVPCEKMRRTHGPNFKIATVKAILNLRTDLSKDERNHAMKICEDILDDFKKHPEWDTLATNSKGIFSSLDMTQAEEAAKQVDIISENLVDDDEEHNYGGALNAEDFDIEGFLKEGGINLEDIDEQAPPPKRKESQEEEEKVGDEE